jgi:hypothetical protein
MSYANLFKFLFYVMPSTVEDKDGYVIFNPLFCRIYTVDDILFILKFDL